jgi:hypothetical protein
MISADFPDDRFQNSSLRALGATSQKYKFIINSKSVIALHCSILWPPRLFILGLGETSETSMAYFHKTQRSYIRTVSMVTGGPVGHPPTEQNSTGYVWIIEAGFWGSFEILLWKMPLFRCEEHLYKRLHLSVGRLVGPSVRPHDAITWKTSYVAIASRRAGGRGKLVTLTSRFLRT